MLKVGSFPFVWVVLFCGLICLGFIIFNLGVYGMHRVPADARLYVTGGDPVRGKKAIEEFGCGACHFISGVREARGRVGPKLDDLDEQMFIAGQLANTPDNLVSWIMDPQKHAPGSAMPDVGVPEDVARDMAAFFYR